MVAEVAVGLAADVALGRLDAGRLAAGAGFIDRRQGGVAVRHRAGVGRVGADIRCVVADGQLPVGEVLTGGRVVCRVGEGSTGGMRGRGAFLDIDEGQRVAGLLREAGIFVCRQNCLRDVCGEGGAGFVRADPDAVGVRNGGIQRVGCRLRGLQRDRAAGDFISTVKARIAGGVLFIVDKECAVLARDGVDRRARKVENAAAGQVEGITAALQVELAALERGRALGNGNADRGAVGNDLAAGHLEAAGELRAHGATGKAELTAGELICRIEREQVAVAISEIDRRAAEFDLAARRDADRLSFVGRRRAGDVERTAGEGGLARAAAQQEAGIGAVDVQRAAGHIEFAALVLGEIDTDGGADRNVGIFADAQRTAAGINVAAARCVERMRAVVEADIARSDVLDRHVEIVGRDAAAAAGEAAAGADGAFRVNADGAARSGVRAVQIQTAGPLRAACQRETCVFVHIYAGVRCGHIDLASLNFYRAVRTDRNTGVIR